MPDVEPLNAGDRSIRRSEYHHPYGYRCYGAQPRPRLAGSSRLSRRGYRIAFGSLLARTVRSKSRPAVAPTPAIQSLGAHTTGSVHPVPVDTHPLWSSQPRRFPRTPRPTVGQSTGATRPIAPLPRSEGARIQRRGYRPSASSADRSSYITCSSAFNISMGFSRCQTFRPTARPFPPASMTASTCLRNS